jgi:rhomboid protease GluP
MSSLAQGDRPASRDLVRPGREDSAPPAMQDDQETPSLLDYPATYLLIGINLAVYALMYRFGPLPAVLRGHTLTAVSFTSMAGLREFGVLLAQIFTEPFSERILTYFGSCNPYLILAHGQWWRLATSMFVHVTMMHLLLNMWCLWNLGLFGEPLLGKPGLVAVYLLTGAAGMLLSLILSVAAGQTNGVVAGASGAVFGLAGILIVLLSNRKLAAPWEELRSLRLQVVFFALANLLLGMLPGLLPRLSPGLSRSLPFRLEDLPRIDNSAHLGGFVCGLALGFPLFPRMTSGKSSYRARQALVFGSAALLLILTAYAVATFAR